MVKNYANNYKVLRGGAKALTELDGIEAGVTEQVKQLKEHVMDGIALETVRTAHPVTTAPPPRCCSTPISGLPHAPWQVDTTYKTLLALQGIEHQMTVKLNMDDFRTSQNKQQGVLDKVLSKLSELSDKVDRLTPAGGDGADGGEDLERADAVSIMSAVEEALERLERAMDARS